MSDEILPPEAWEIPPNDPMPTKISDRPHWITITLGLISILGPLMAGAALWISAQSLRTSRDSLQISQRPYLSVSQPQLQVARRSDAISVRSLSGSIDFKFSGKLVNSGNTPALDVTGAFNIDGDKATYTVYFPKDVNPRSEDTFSAIIAFDFTKDSGSRLLSNMCHAGPLNVEISYTDVFEVKRGYYMAIPLPEEIDQLCKSK